MSNHESSYGHIDATDFDLQKQNHAAPEVPQSGYEGCFLGCLTIILAPIFTVASFLSRFFNWGCLMDGCLSVCGIVVMLVFLAMKVINL